MNKWLLAWSVVATVLLLLFGLGACSDSSSQISTLSQQVEANRLAIAQLQATVAQQSQQIQAQSAQTAALQATIQQLPAAFQQFVMQYVQQYLPAK